MARSRFRFDGDRAMRVMRKGSLLAFFNFRDTESGLEYYDWRLVDGSKGPFVAPPARSYEKDGETRYSDYIRVADKGKDEDGREFFLELAEAAEKKFLELADTEDEAPRRSQRTTKGKPVTRKSRPPVDDEEEEEDDDFPFG